MIQLVMVVSDKEAILLQIQWECNNKEVFWKLEKWFNVLNEFKKAEGHKCILYNHAQLNAQKYCVICQKWMCHDMID